MAEEIEEKEQDEIVEDIEASLEKMKPGNRAGYRMLIYPNGVVEIAAGEIAAYSTLGNPHFSCCCCWG